MQYRVIKKSYHVCRVLLKKEVEHHCEWQFVVCFGSSLCHLKNYSIKWCFYKNHVYHTINNQMIYKIQKIQNYLDSWDMIFYSNFQPVDFSILLKFCRYKFCSLHPHSSYYISCPFLVGHMKIVLCISLVVYADNGQ